MGISSSYPQLEKTCCMLPLRQSAKRRRVSDQWAEKFTRLQDTCKAEIAKKDAEAAQLRRQVDRLKLYQAQLEKEKEQLAQQLYQEQENCKLQLQARDGEVAYLERKLTRPLKHTDVVEWVRQQFADRLIMHKRTRDFTGQENGLGRGPWPAL